MRFDIKRFVSRRLTHI